MTAVQPAYRLTLFAPRSVDPAEATVLTPVPGSAHNDPFQVASQTGVAGFRPYLEIPRGRRGRIDLLSRRLDIGSLTFGLIDLRVGGSNNLLRWWSAFFGDSQGRPRGQLKVQIDESLDGGVTWSTFLVGRLNNTRLESNRVRILLEVREETQALKMDVWVGIPHASITYAAVPSLLPVGVLGSSYGTIPTALPLTGTTINILIIDAAPYRQEELQIVVLDAASAMRRDNLVTQQLVESVAPDGAVAWGQSSVSIPGVTLSPVFSGPGRARIKHLTGTFAGQTGDYLVGGLQILPTVGSSPRHAHVSEFVIKALDAGDANHLPVPTAGTQVEVFLFREDAISKEHPLLLDDVDPATLLLDLCAGKFGYLYRSPEALPPGKAYGDIKRSVTASNVASFVGIHPPSRWRIEKREQLIDWIEDHLLKQYHWAAYLDKLGRFTLVDLRLPGSLAGVVTVTDDDLVADATDADWEHDPTAAITRVEFKRYFDSPTTTDQLATQTDYLPSLPDSGIVKSFEHPVTVLDVGSSDFGDQTYSVDADGYRAMSGEQLQGQDRSIYLENKLVELANHLRRPFGVGSTTTRIACRRTPTTSSLVQGSLLLLSLGHIPNPASRARGGTRLCRVLEVSEDGPQLQLDLIDLAVSTTAAPPVLAQPVPQSSNTFSGVTTDITLNGLGQPVEVHYAVTATSVSVAPAEASLLWSSTGRLVRTSSTVTITNLPTGARCWIRARTTPDGTAGDLEIPSAWVAAGGTGYADTTALPPPTNLAVPTKTDTTALLTWTVGSAQLPVEVLLATPPGASFTQVARLLPTSSAFQFIGLKASTSYRAAIRHLLGLSPGVLVTFDFTTLSAAAAVQAPTPLALEVVV